MLQVSSLDQKKVTEEKQRYSLKAIFWFTAILLGAIQAWSNRYNIASEDGISYLDIGDAYFKGDWSTAINAYWSPLYSWILGLALNVLKPSAYWEFPVVKIVNFLIYLFAIVCFDFFLQELRFYYLKKVSQVEPNKFFQIPDWVWIVSGYTLFVWTSLKWIGIASDTPDMCTAALVYLASGIILRIHTCSDNWFNFITLGLVLGLAYLSKAVMFPLAFVFLAVGMFSGGNLRRAFPRTLAAILTFTLITSPFIFALSTTKGHLTFGETGKLNYAWLVNPGEGVIPDMHWQGGPPSSGTPKHPTRQIFDDPLVFEFATPIGGTYAPWYDPTYWNEGLKVKFDLFKQLKAIAHNANFYYKQFLGSLVFCYLILVGTSGEFWLSVKELIGNWRVVILAASGLGAYVLTHASPRLIAAFVVLLFTGVFSSVRLPNLQESKRLIATMTVVFLAFGSIHLSVTISKDLVNNLRHRENTYWQVAEELHHLGIQPGDKVAILTYDYDFTIPHVNWARLSRAKIVAEIHGAERFWEKDAAVRSQVLTKIERTGAKAIVDHHDSAIKADLTSWQEIAHTGYYAYFFKR